MSETRRLVILFLVGLLTTISQMGMRVALPLAAIEHGATPFLIGVLMAVFSVLSALFGVPAGRWMDRVGRRTPILLTCVLMTIALLAPWIVPELWTLFLSNALFGFAYSTLYLALTVAVGALSRPENRTLNLSWIAMTGSIGSLLGPVIGGHLTDAIGTHATLAVLAAGPAIGFVIVLLARGPRPAAIGGPPPAAPRRTLDLLSIRDLRELLIVGGLLGLSWDVFTFVVPLFGTQIGLSAGEIGNIVGAFGFGSLLVRLAMPVIMRGFREGTLLTLSLGLIATVFFAFPVFRSSGPLFLLTFCYGLAWGAVQPVLNALLYTAAPEGRVSEALGLRNTLQSGLHSVIPALFGVIGSAFGMTPVFLVAGALLGAATWGSRGRWK